jgi:hypothetical protein
MNTHTIRNLARQDQVETMQREWLTRMSNERLLWLMQSGVEWMQRHEERGQRVAVTVPADLAQEAVTCLIIRLSNELQTRLAELHDSDSQRGQTAEEEGNDD